VIEHAISSYLGDKELPQVFEGVYEVVLKSMSKYSDIEISATTLCEVEPYNVANPLSPTPL
jgi:hypothetical protein